MIQPVTLLGAGLSIVVLFLRYRTQRKDRPRRSRQQKLKTAKILGAALLAWLTLNYSLQHMIAKIDGTEHEPSLMERIVFLLSK